jgi:four helix bundle protein
MKIKSYKDLEIYQLSFQLATELHDLSLKFPKFEMFEEGSQLRKSSKSIPATIAEGWGRRYYKNEFIRFLIYALASCDETVVHLDFVYNSQYISGDQYKGYAERYNVLGKKINRYLQMVMRDHLRPQDKSKKESAIENYSQQGIVDDEWTYQRATRNHQLATSNQKLATSNKQPETSNQQPS